jgi:hypothetical protein
MANGVLGNIPSYSSHPCPFSEIEVEQGALHDPGREAALVEGQVAAVDLRLLGSVLSSVFF